MLRFVLIVKIASTISSITSNFVCYYKTLWASHLTLQQQFSVVADGSQNIVISHVVLIS